jgi:thiol:disulfide interchange protein
MAKRWLLLWTAVWAVLPLTGAPFVWDVALQDGFLTVTVNFEPGCYLYADQLELRVTGRDGRELPPEAIPEPVMHEDAFEGKIVPIFNAASAPAWRYRERGAPPWTVAVDFQGCRDARDGVPGICFMPESLELTVDAAGATAARERAAAGSVGDVYDALPSLRGFSLRRIAAGYLDVPAMLEFLRGAGEVPEGTGAAAAVKSDWAQMSWWMVLLAAIAGGLALNLTPCVLPMIPVNLAIIGAGKKAESRWAAFRRASFYALGMVLAYGGLGLLVVLAGARFGFLHSSWIFNAVIAVVFVLLALAMSGIFQLDLSRFSSSLRLSQWKVGPGILAFMLGVTAALLAGACVAPVVIAVLTLAAGEYAQGNWWALFLPFMLGLGMALPWPLIGLGVRVLPKPGGWMVYVKYVFSVFILGLAVYYAALAWNLASAEAAGHRELARLEERLAAARPGTRPVLIDFYASWCKNCSAMERGVFPDAAVRRELERFEVVKFRAEDLGEEAIVPLLEYCRVRGLPAFAVLEPDGMAK